MHGSGCATLQQARLIGGLKSPQCRPLAGVAVGAVARGLSGAVAVATVDGDRLT